jgi:ABC-2 type transport system permease protein
MNTQSNAMSESFQAQSAVPTAIPASRSFYWSVRRELWENRSIYMAPVAVAVVVFFAFSVSAILGIWEPHLRLVPSRPQMPYDMADGVLMLTGIIVSVFYCLEALQSERRDRSILFWKSLPVSDVTTVLAKASIPLIVVPLLTFAITIAMHWMMLLASSAVLLVSGQSVATLWRSLPLASMWLLLLYHLITAHAIWPFPIYCWLLLVSGWARRATFLWAALPLLAIAAVEGIVFRTRYFAELVGRRFIGDAPAMHNMAPDSMGLDPLTTHVTVGRFLSSPGLWIGFAIAAVFLAAAVRLRRYQEPI